MSTLKKLRESGAGRRSDRPKEPPTKVVGAGEPDPTKLPSASQADWRIPTAAVLRASRSGKLPAAAPCPNCGGPIFWLDPAGRVHCGECRRPPSYAVQRGDLHVITLPDGSPGWMHDHAELTHGDGGGENRPVNDHPPDVPEAGRSRPVDFEDLDDGVEPPCEKCGRLDFWWNFHGERRCLKCTPPGGKPPPISRVHSQLLTRTLSVELRGRAESSPATAAFRKQKAERIAAEEQRQAEVERRWNEEQAASKKK